MTKEVDVLLETLAAIGVDLTLPATASIGQVTLEPRPSSAPPVNLPSARIGPGGDFEPKRELGRGGMGVVELANQTALSRDVAVKRLLASSPRHVDALLHEAVIAGQLEHPNIVPVHAVVIDTRGPAVVMKRISGVEWADALGDEGRSLDADLQVLLQVCSAVAFAHSRGVIHRDIKPANVMIGEFDEVYLVDWGLARRLDENGKYSGQIAGTPAYIAPEMVHGEAGTLSDVFLLGATLHEILSGAPRHAGESLRDVLQSAESCEPFDYGAEVDPELAAICNRACALEPADRFPSVGELRDALREYLRNRTAAALLKVAKAKSSELERNLSGDYVTVQRLFNEARFAFDQAHNARPDHDDTLTHRDSCFETMARHELGLGHADVAETLLDAMHSPPEELLARTHELVAEQAAERERLAALERDRDPEVGLEERRRATYILAAATVLLVGAFVALRRLFPMYADGATRLLLVGAIVFVVGSAIVHQWKKWSEPNLINHRIQQVVIGTLGLSLLNRIVSVLSGSEVAEILLRDSLLQVGCGLALAPFHPAGRGLAVGACVVSIVGALHPEWLEWMFISLAVVIPAAFLLRRARADPPTRAA